MFVRLYQEKKGLIEVPLWFLVVLPSVLAFLINVVMLMYLVDFGIHSRSIAVLTVLALAYTVWATFVLSLAFVEDSTKPIVLWPLRVAGV